MKAKKAEFEAAIDGPMIKFIFEARQLRFEPRKGWTKIGENYENVAEHCLRAAQLAYLLAHAEGHDDPSYVASLLLFHDFHETRTGDRDKLNKEFVNPDDRAVARAQTKDLREVGEQIFNMWEEFETTDTEAAIIAKDADILEMAFTARELQVSRGNQNAELFINNARERLKTETALRLLDQMAAANPCDWWMDICEK